MGGMKWPGDDIYGPSGCGSSGEVSEVTEQDIARALRALMYGLTQNNYKAAFTAHRALYKIGAPVIPHIQEAVRQSDWSKVRYSNEVRLLCGLMALFHDLDEKEAAALARELKRNGCHSTVAQMLDSVCRFADADYIQYQVLGIPVYEQRLIRTKQPVRPKLETWLRNVPGDDLKEIERLYVLRRQDLDSLGRYRPYLCSINLVWFNDCRPWNPGSYLNNFITEHTLYHEIGHHRYRHTFGQDEQQEREANEYADYIMAQSQHLPFRLIRALFGPLRPPNVKPRVEI